VVAVAHCRHGLEVEDEGFLKYLVIIFFRYFVLFIVSFNGNSILKKCETSKSTVVRLGLQSSNS
jgi:hypothetical protein